MQSCRSVGAPFLVTQRRCQYTGRPSSAHLLRLKISVGAGRQPRRFFLARLTGLPPLDTADAEQVKRRKFLPDYPLRERFDAQEVKYGTAAWRREPNVPVLWWNLPEQPATSKDQLFSAEDAESEQSEMEQKIEFLRKRTSQEAVKIKRREGMTLRPVAKGGEALPNAIAYVLEAPNFSNDEKCASILSRLQPDFVAVDFCQETFEESGQFSPLVEDAISTIECCKIFLMARPNDFIDKRISRVSDWKIKFNSHWFEERASKGKTSEETVYRMLRHGGDERRMVLEDLNEGISDKIHRLEARNFIITGLKILMEDMCARKAEVSGEPLVIVVFVPHRLIENLADVWYDRVALEEPLMIPTNSRWRTDRMQRKKMLRRFVFIGMLWLIIQLKLTEWKYKRQEKKGIYEVVYLPWEKRLPNSPVLVLKDDDEEDE